MESLKLATRLSTSESRSSPTGSFYPSPPSSDCTAVGGTDLRYARNRIKASLELNDAARQAALDKSHQALEKYFFLIAFAAFVEDSDGLQGRFSGWLKARSEIWKYVPNLILARWGLSVKEG